MKKQIRRTWEVDNVLFAVHRNTCCFYNYRSVAYKY